MKRFDYHRPASVEDACKLLADLAPGARVIAGGTGVGILMKEGLLDADHLVSLEHLPLGEVAWRDGALSVGAGVTLQTLVTHPLVQARLPIVGRVVAQVASRRIRNVATLGGNLCWAEAASDPPGLLVALDAEVIARSVRGQRRLVVRELITDYFTTALAPDELLSEVRIPAPPSGTGIAYIKYTPLSKADKPVLGVTAVVERGADGALGRARVVVSAAGPTPLSLPEVDEELTGAPLDGAAVARAAERYSAAARPVSDTRGSERYKRRMIGVLVRRALGRAWEEAARS